MAQEIKYTASFGRIGIAPTGLFSFPEEKYLRRDADLRPEMHPLWTITTKRPKHKEIVQSIRKMSYYYISRLICDKI